MPRPEIDRFQEHDRAFDGRGNTGVVVKFNRKSDGRSFFMVWVQAGPLKGQRVWPNYPWMADLDWSSDGLSTVCHSCDRVFRGDASTPRRVFCKSCYRDDAARAARRSADTGRDQYHSDMRPRVARHSESEGPF